MNKTETRFKGRVKFVPVKSRALPLEQVHAARYCLLAQDINIGIEGR